MVAGGIGVAEAVGSGVGVAVLVAVAVGTGVSVVVAVAVGVAVGRPRMLPGPLISLVKVPVMPELIVVVTRSQVVPAARLTVICGLAPIPSSSAATQFVSGAAGLKLVW
jgi:hypothetical protein